MASTASTGAALSLMGGGGTSTNALPGGASAALDAAGLAVGVPGASGFVTQALGALKSFGLGGGNGNPDSAFSVARQKIRETKLQAMGRHDDRDRASELFFSTGRGVEERKRYKPGQPFNLPNGVKNYSVVSHFGHQALPRLTDDQIIALAPGGKYVPSDGAAATGHANGVVGANGVLGANGNTGVVGPSFADGSAGASPAAPTSGWKLWALVGAAFLFVLFLIFFLVR